MIPESYFTAGYITDLLYYIKFSPSILLVNDNLNPPSVSLNASIEFDKTLTLGIGSRNLNSMVGTLQLHSTNKIQIGYSYQHFIGPLANLMKNAHALSVNFNSCGFKGGMESRFYCPACAMK